MISRNKYTIPGSSTDRQSQIYMIKHLKKTKTTKPCPTCYNPMLKTHDGKYYCEKHGPPTRD